jgi:hypothetical protein
MSSEKQSHPEGCFFILAAWVSPVIPIVVSIAYVVINPKPRADTSNMLLGLFALTAFVVRAHRASRCRGMGMG